MDGLTNANSITPTLAAIATPFYVVSALIAAFGNIFCLIVLWQPSQRSTSNIIMTSLALSDSLVGFVCFPSMIWIMNIPQDEKGSPMSFWIFQIYGFSTIWFASNSICSIVFIAYDRYIHITKSRQYHEILPKRKVVLVIITFWIISFIFALSTIMLSFVYLAILPLFLIVSTLIICVSYYLIWKAVKESQRRIAFNTVGNRQEQRVQNRMAKKVFLLITMYLCVVAFLFIHAILSFVVYKKPGIISTEVMAIVLVITTYVTLSNSCSNLVAYVWKDPEFKAACKRSIRKAWSKTRIRPNVERQGNQVELRDLS